MTSIRIMLNPQLLMGDDVKSCMEAIENPHESDEDLHILERINMSFSVYNAIVNAPNITRFKIEGDLPELQLNFSDRRYRGPITTHAQSLLTRRNTDEIYRCFITQVRR